MADRFRLLINEKPSAAVKFVNDKEGGVNVKHIEIYVYIILKSTHFIRYSV